MIQLRKAQERGASRLDWLDSRHSFSFADYHDPRYMGYRALRVINEDRIAPGAGFPSHPHRDMEIVTFVLEGALEHRDSLGNGSVIRPGEIQRMSAGTGIVHSEFNPSQHDSLHLMQIWLLPGERGLPPSYEQRRFGSPDAGDGFVILADPFGGPDSVAIHQDVTLSIGRLDCGGRATHRLAPGRHVWVQVARGGLTLNGHSLGAGDGAAIDDEARLEFQAETSAEVLLFDLA
ncbi:MAG: pirin family protein [Candidatus Binataceae bacterium]|nr:pirin family protein [Candidatus Binataceae bacterium]